MTDTPRETPEAERLLKVIRERWPIRIELAAQRANPAKRGAFATVLTVIEARAILDALAECDTLRAQLAAEREGEIATLRIQHEQAEAEVLRHHEREGRLKEEALSWRRVSERLQGERLAAEARADTAEAQLRAQGWQPTETAPKDEVRVLLFNPDESLGAWAVQAGAHYEQLGGWQYDNQNPRYSNAHPPTHWMPLPAPPITKEPQPHE